MPIGRHIQPPARDVTRPYRHPTSPSQLPPGTPALLTLLASALTLLLAACSHTPRRTAPLHPQPSTRTTPQRPQNPAWESTANLSRSILEPNPSPAAHTNSNQSPTPPPLDTTTEWIPLNTWTRTYAQLDPQPLSPNADGWELPTPLGPLQLLAGTRQARLGDFDLWLGFPPAITSEGLLVHHLDWEKNIWPTLSPPPIPIARRIVIDPGHGGSNLGTLSVLDRSHEKTYTLDWALRLAPLLADGGWQVTLTRTNDLELHPTQRIAIADATQADLFISLHFNSAAPDLTKTGIETYCLTPVGLPSTLTRSYPDDLTLALPNNAFDHANLFYATRLHQALIQATGGPDRGVRRARFMAVLQDQQRPAVLIEGGFLSNPSEAAKIASPQYRQLLAETTAATLNALGPNPSAFTQTSAPQ